VINKARSQFLILISTAVGVLLISACKSPAPRSDTNQTSTNAIISSTPPFQTKEPERYQAVRSMTFSKAGGKSVKTRTLLAKDGEMRRDEYQTETNQKIVYLDLPAGRFILLPEAKLYADLSSEAGGGLDPSDRQDIDSENSPDRLLNTDPIAARYEKMGGEVVNGRNTSKYRVLVNTSTGGTVSNRETLIWIDEALGLPLKSETVTSNGDRTDMELSGIVLEVDKHLFEIPDGYKRVAPREIRERLNTHD
jgi:outer membrane lipoprotein-sorting protein